MRNFLAFAMVLLMGAVVSRPAQAETWNFPSGYPDNNFHTQTLRWFADEVSKRSNGELDFAIHSGASMFKMPELKRAVRTGQVPIAEFILSAYGNEDALYEADSVPFLAVGQEQAKKLYELQKPMLDERLGKEGLVILYSVPWPANSLYTQTPVTTVADLKGMKMRGQTPIVARLVELSGAVPVNVQFVEVPQAFQTGVVTGMFTSGTTGVNTQAWDYTKYYYDTAGYSPKDAVVVNKQSWDALSPELQAIMREVAAEAEERGWAAARALEVDARTTLAENGIEVIDPSPELMAEFQKIGDQMIAEWVERAGEDGKKLVDQMRAQ
ncbi:MAG: TRAP transporter substrate-binding protein [Nitratireductor sp.]